MNEDIEVSIVCNVYNHAEYLEKAILSFINQVTNFKYEICIFDDASGDMSQEIIRKYHDMYPDLINPYLSECNFFSQGRDPFRFNISRARGRFIALCEGDDYWIDVLKLQKQFDYMHSHSKCSFCFTNGKVLIGDKVVGKVVPWQYGESKKFPVNKLDYNPGELEELGYIPTASFFFSKKDYERIPTPRKDTFSGDTYFKLFLTELGYAHFINDETCVYRFQRAGSYTTNWKKNRLKYVEFIDRYINMLIDINAYTQNKYVEIFNNRINLWKINRIIILKKYEMLVDRDLMKSANNNSLRFMIKFYVYFIIGVLDKLHGKWK